jgi:hypothetical protein
MPYHDEYAEATCDGRDDRGGAEARRCAARAGRVDESAMQRRLEWLGRGSEADPRAARLRRWVLDYWRERQ